MSDYQGNIVIKNPTPPAGPSTYGRAPGMWKLNDVAYWIKQGVWPNTNIVPDLNFPNVSLLLSTTSLGNANNNMFVDSGGAFNPVIRGGSVATLQGSFTPYGTNWSNYFDGSGDYLTIPSNAAFDFGTGDFTIECWFSLNVTSPNMTMMTNYTGGTAGWGFQWRGDAGQFRFFWGDTVLLSYTVTPTIGTWYHIAVSRSGTSLQMFLNGTQVASATNSTSLSGGSTVSVGALNASGYIQNFNGYISNARAVKGSAVYTSNFTVPTSPLTAISGTSLLTCQSNRFRDASANNFTITVNGNTSVQDFSPFSPAYPGLSYNQSDITNWSGYFASTGTDGLSFPSTSAVDVSTGSFTFECWVYFNGFGSDKKYIIQFSGGNYWQLVHDSSFGISLRVTGYSEIVGQGSNSGWVTGQWYHVALVRNGNNWNIYRNGVSIASATNSSSIGYYSPTYVANYSSGNSINGYMSNVRLVKGTAVYTSNFTPPTAPLTAISGTGLLTLQNAAFTDNSTNNHVITPLGSATVTGNNPFNTTGYWSNYFDGSGDYLSVASNAAFDCGTGDWTIEGWVNIATRTTNYPAFFSNNRGGFALSPPGLAITVSNSDNASYNDKFVFAWGSGGFTSPSAGNAYLLVANATNSVSTWYHLAVVRNGTSIKMYRNGTEVASATISAGSTFDWGYNGALIGGNNWDGANSYMNGYVSNFRFVKGTAVYTAAFTPPTSPLTAISGTSLLTCQNGRFIDNSTNAFTVNAFGETSVQSFDPFYTSTVASNGGSMYFSSTSTGSLETILNVPASNTLDIGAGDFTVECWVYLTATQNYSRIIQFNNTWASAGATPLINANTDTQKLTVSSFDFNAALITADNTYIFNTWYHVAVTRSGNVFSMYINGVKQSGTYTTSSRLWATTTPFMSIGNGPTSVGGFSPMQGYVADVRIIKGSAIYTANFTPPTTPLTPTPATVLLVNGMNAGIYDAATINDMETVGNAQVSTAQSKFGGSSIYVPSSGGCALIRNSQPLVLGTGNWTVEFWAYTDASGSKVYFDALNAANTTFAMEIYSAGTTIYWVKPGGAVAITGTGALSANTWQHIAACKSGSSTRLFVNGVQVGSTYTDNDTYNSARWEIGGRANLTFPIVGYMDDFRITTGVARYTSNFTPPTQAFPTY